MEKHALILASLSGLEFPEENFHEIQESSHSGNTSPHSPPTAVIPSTSSEEDDLDISSEENNPGTSGNSPGSRSDTKKRIRTTPEQLRLLEKTYEQEKIPSQSLREELALKLVMTPRRVQVWFQNKRAKERRMRKSIRSAQNAAIADYQFLPSLVNSGLRVTGLPGASSGTPIHTYPRVDLDPACKLPGINVSVPAYSYSALHSPMVFPGKVATPIYPAAPVFPSAIYPKNITTDWDQKIFRKPFDSRKFHEPFPQVTVVAKNS